MSRGPTDLARVRWLVYPFGAALLTLLGYIVVYLLQITRRKLPPVDIAADDYLSAPGA